MIKIPFFVLLEELERRSADSIRLLVQESPLSVFLKDPKRLDFIQRKVERHQKEDTDRGLVAELYFREVLEAAVHFGKLPAVVQQIEELSAVRNRVAHATSDDQLVETHADVRMLRRVRDFCLDFL